MIIRPSLVLNSVVKRFPGRFQNIKSKLIQKRTFRSTICKWNSSIQDNNNNNQDELISLEEIQKNMPEEDKERLSHIRNIGISAHIDSGKTTFTERVLFYTGRIEAIHEVRGKDNVGATMDFMDLEREKGITIQSAATYCVWEKKENNKIENYRFNLIDTPGHIDFTIEVERALRVLDGAVLVVCAVSGVQSQTMTVDRQMRRYNVPRVTFINKLDRMGANPWRAIEQLNQKLKLPAAAIQVPIGTEGDLEGVIDIIERKALYNKGPNGEIIEIKQIPENFKEIVEEKRTLLIETLADIDEEIEECFLTEKEPTIQQIKQAIRRTTINNKFTPVLMGSALANRGVQAALDAICNYLPNPSEIRNIGLDVSKSEKPVTLLPYNSAPFVGLAFKLEEGKFGQLTYIRVYQGKIKKGLTIVNARTGKRSKLPSLVRMHSNNKEEVPEVGAGEICATYGVECSSGDTFVTGNNQISMSSMFVPEPVVSLSIKPTQKDSANFSKAMNRFQREDPTFRVKYDSEIKETIISGMGELHLEIYVERMKREYGVECITGKPQVAYRETITTPVEFDHTLKKQTGGAGQYAKVMGKLMPLNGENKFEADIFGGKIPEKFLAACDGGFWDATEKGPLTGHKVLGVHMLINDGATHAVDSSELSFRTCTRDAFVTAFKKANPIVLEPIMAVTLTAPIEFQGTLIGLMNKKGAIINDTEVGVDEFTLHADCSLNNLFGFVTTLRANTQGKGEYTMEFKKYESAPVPLQNELIKAYEKELKEKEKK